MSSSEIIQENHFYAFGLELTGDWNTVPNVKQRYRYNGKEFNEDLGLYDYGARWYDPATAMWASVDPLASLMSSWSPYNYVLGNPIRLIDPDGMAPEDPITDKLNAFVRRHNTTMKSAYAQTKHGAGNQTKEVDLTFIATPSGQDRVTTDNVGMMLDGTMSFAQPDLGTGETHLANYHSHPNDSDQPITKGGTAFSEADIMNTNSINLTDGFTSILETSDKRYALVITDAEAYSTFSSGENKSANLAGLLSATNSALRSAYQAHKAGGGTRHDFDERVVVASAQAQYLRDNNAGVSYYESTSSDKNDFKKVE